MKSREVMRLLNISRNTLHNYVKRGLIKVIDLLNLKLIFLITKR